MTNEQIQKELKRISDSIPKALLKQVAFEDKMTPNMEMVVQKGLDGEIKDPSKKAELEHLMKQGYFSQKKLYENSRVAKMIDNFVQRKINEAIKKGRLPHPKNLKDPFIKHIKDIITKENAQNKN